MRDEEVTVNVRIQLIQIDATVQDFERLMADWMVIEMAAWVMRSHLREPILFVAYWLIFAAVYFPLSGGVVR